MVIVEATRAINTGSGHIAIKAIYYIVMLEQIKRKRKRVRAWRAQDLKSHHDKLKGALIHNEVHSSMQLTNIIAECRKACSSYAHGRNGSLKKPWLTTKFNDLVN